VWVFFHNKIAEKKHGAGIRYRESTRKYLVKEFNKLNLSLLKNIKNKKKYCPQI